MVGDLQAAKSVVQSYLSDMVKTCLDTVRQIISRHMAHEYHWRGMHRFNEQNGAEAVPDIFWSPFLSAFAPVQRLTDVFLAGTYNARDDGTVWVMSMGHLLGLFDQPWLGIPPTRKIAMLRFAEFHRIEDGRIIETGTNAANHA